MGCFSSGMVVVVAEGKQVTGRKEAEDGGVADGDEEIGEVIRDFLRACVRVIVES